MVGTMIECEYASVYNVEDLPNCKHRPKVSIVVCFYATCTFLMLFSPWLPADPIWSCMNNRRNQNCDSDHIHTVPSTMSLVTLDNG